MPSMNQRKPNILQDKLAAAQGLNPHAKAKPKGKLPPWPKEKLSRQVQRALRRGTTPFE